MVDEWPRGFGPDKGSSVWCPMTSDERAQLVEDIQRSAKIREGIVEQARLNKEFDLTAAWEELDELDKSINARVVESRVLP